MNQKTIAGIPLVYEKDVKQINQQIHEMQAKGETLIICSKCQTILITRNISKCPECGSNKLI